MSSYFAQIDPVRYEGPDTQKPLAYRFYDKDRKVFGKRMEDQLRFSVVYWHTFGNVGRDIFGQPAFDRPWATISDPMDASRAKAESAFDFISKLGVKYYAFHDRDVAPEGVAPRESLENLQAMVDVLAGHQQRTGIKLLWGTADLFGHRRYLAGAATNPDPEIFAMAATQVKAAMDATYKLGGENYVLWGGREGYETLLNTDMKKELDQLGRFLSMVVEYKKKIGFKGTILIEPKPREPTKHQYDFDVAAVYAFLRSYGLEKEVKVNVEANHATLAGHTFEHEIVAAAAYGIFGSIDINRGDPLLGWDTDQFPNNVPDAVLALYAIMQAGGFTTGGLNFDAKVRRQSIDAIDLFYGHVGAMDVYARALLITEQIMNDGFLAKQVAERYQGWTGKMGQEIMAGRMGLDDLSKYVLDRNMDVEPVSGRQELIENLLNRFC